MEHCLPSHVQQATIRTWGKGKARVIDLLPTIPTVDTEECESLRGRVSSHIERSEKVSEPITCSVTNTLSDQYYHVSDNFKPKPAREPTTPGKWIFIASPGLHRVLDSASKGKAVHISKLRFYKHPSCYITIYYQ